MNSIKSLVSAAVEEYRQRTKVLSVLDNPNALMAEKAEAIKTVMSGNSSFWLEVTKITTHKSVTVSVPSTPEPATIPANQMPTKSMPAMPVQSATSPARKLQAEPDSAFKTWVGFLKSAANGGNPPWKALQNLTVKIFADTGTKLSQFNWELLFAAMKVANENGKYIIGNDANPAMIFQVAPLDLVSDYLFGLEGIVPSLTGEIFDGKGDAMPGWLCAKTSLALDAVGTIDARCTLSVQEDEVINRLLDALESKEVPEWLSAKAKTIWTGDEIVPVPVEKRILDRRWSGSGQLAEALSAVH